MTIYQPLREPVEVGASLANPTLPSPPLAPLAMPKQVLTHDQSSWLRLQAFLRAGISAMRPGVRRAG